MAITIEYLKSQLSYDPDTGLFTWLIDRYKAKKGNIAGSNAGNGYIYIKLNYDRFYAHRLAYFYMTGKWPEKTIDHINGVKSDNRWLNIRPATNTENSYNCSLRSHNKSGYKGVYQLSNGRYCAQIVLNGNKINIGFYKTPEEASEAYINYANIYHGEFIHSSVKTNV